MGKKMDTTGTKLQNLANAAEVEETLDSGESLGKRARRKLMSRPIVVASFAIIALYIAVAGFAYLDWLPDFQQRISTGQESPSWELAKILGTDVFGRSVFFKILAGTKTAMTMGFLVTMIAIPLGVILGSIAGFYGGVIDSLIAWVYSVVISVPYILLVVAMSYALGKGLVAVCIALGSVSWIGLCRMIRGEVLKHKNREYVLAARLIGASDAVIMFRHILPNVVHLAIITGSLMVLGAIKSEVILTFIGVGIQDGASWGSMISSAPGELVNGIWWPLAGVVAAMFFIIYALNVVGDAMRDALDPKLLD
jgi:peptide/nickel transport system permease protein